MGWLFRRQPLHHEKAGGLLRTRICARERHDESRVFATATVRRSGLRGDPQHQRTDRRVIRILRHRAVQELETRRVRLQAVDESMGPCEVNCPGRIMRLLSPIEDIPDPGYAADWRARVAEAKANAPGCTRS